MKKVALIILGILGLLIVGTGVFMYFQNEPRPEGKIGPEADRMAVDMMQAVNSEAWDSLAYISWSFPGGHDYVWNKTKDMVKVSWNDNTVILNTKEIDGKAYENGQLVDGSENDELIQTAWSYFCNDSWWLNPTVKANDPGTERSIVTLEDSRKGLMVTYSSGGVTPGDAYVYVLDENNRPSSYLMWVSIIPVGGLEFSFDEWTELPGGALIATAYGSAMKLEISNIKAGQSISDLGLEENPFE